MQKKLYLCGRNVTKLYLDRSYSPRSHYGLRVISLFGQSDIFSEILNSTFAAAKNGFEISIGLTGVLALWMGILNIGQQGGVVNTLSQGVAPFFRRIFPEIPTNHPVYGTMFMNFAATLLVLDNAATPM
jgi:spore maturation protein SpmA